MDYPEKPPMLRRSSSTISVSWDDVPLLGWLTQGGPQHPKHSGWTHPMAVLVVHYMTTCYLAVQAHDWMLQYVSAPEKIDQCQVDDRLQYQRNLSALWLVCYAAALLIWRVFFVGQPAATYNRYVLYDYCWMCTGSLWLGAWALFTQRPILASAVCVAVGHDQLLWYLDLGWYFVAGKFPVGVAKYLSWPENRKYVTFVLFVPRAWRRRMLSR